MQPQSDSKSTYLTNYGAYLVRLWQDTPGNAWRASAQSIQHGEVFRFSSLQDLFDFLENETQCRVD